jgi:hypothetical protein
MAGRGLTPRSAETCSVTVLVDPSTWHDGCPETQRALDTEVPMRSPLIAVATASFAAIATIVIAGPGSKQVRPPHGSSTSTAHFVTSEACASCHNGLWTADGEELSLETEWQTSMMSHSFIDPLWQAKVRTEMLRIPALSSVIEEKCVRCHAPMAAVEAASSGEKVAIFGDGFIDPAHPYHQLAMDGVGCTLCHQIQNSDALGTPTGWSGGFSIANPHSAEGRRIYAQYDNPFTRPMIENVGYLPMMGMQMHEAEVCATCHQLLTDYVDDSGAIASTPETRFPEQTPYTEWLHSDFGHHRSLETSCQVCHMIRAGDARIASRPPWLPVRSEVSRHQFMTGNTTLLGILGTFSEELGTSAWRTARATNAAREYLPTAATLETVNASLVNGVLEITVRVVNRTGHKLPTGIPLRRMYLHTAVEDPAGTIVFESGPLLDDHRIEGVDADTDPTAFEPHHDVITSEDQVQVYEAIMHTVEGELTYTLLRASGYLKDNRILPRGLAPEDAPALISPQGSCRTDSNFVGGSDEVTYRIARLYEPAYTVTIELRYQPVSYPFVRDLSSESDDPYVERFSAMYAAIRSQTELVAQMTAEVRRSETRRRLIHRP